MTNIGKRSVSTALSAKDQLIRLVMIATRNSHNRESTTASLVAADMSATLPTVRHTPLGCEKVVPYCQRLPRGTLVATHLRVSNLTGTTSSGRITTPSAFHNRPDLFNALRILRRHRSAE